MSDILTPLKAVLKTTPARWHALVEHFPAEMLRRQPKAGEWCALECLQHLIDLDRAVFPQRVEALLHGQDFPAYFPDRDGTPFSDSADAAAMAAEFEALRQKNLRLIDQIQPADLTRQAGHEELGIVTLGNLLHEWGGHDLMHLVQAEQTLMQPFIAGCGPWQMYFTQHQVTADRQ